MTGVLKRRGTETDPQAGKVHVTMETEVGVMKPQAKECPGPPEAGRGEAGSSHRAFGAGFIRLKKHFVLISLKIVIKWALKCPQDPRR